jgi:hypothetical protein
MRIIETSANRVRRHTSKAMNARIDQKMRANLAYFADHPEEIGDRLAELDAEWDVERILELNSSTISLLGLVLGALRSRKWLILPSAVQFFFLQHGVQGWCPPLPLLRKLGVRTQREIETEREGLKAIRGDIDVDCLVYRSDFTI